MPLQRPRCGPRPRRPPGHQGRGRRHLVPGMGRRRAPRPFGAPALRGALGRRRRRAGGARAPRRPAVWGEPKVADPLLAKARAAWRDRLGTRYLPTLEAQMDERRAAAGDVAFLLEPDLKESHGGLRDVSVLRAISAYAPLAGRLRRPGLARRCDRRCSPRSGSNCTDGRARAGQAAPAGPGPGGGLTRLRRCRRPHGRRLGRRAPDRLGQRRRRGDGAGCGIPLRSTAGASGVRRPRQRPESLLSLSTSPTWWPSTGRSPLRRRGHLGGSIPGLPAGRGAAELDRPIAKGSLHRLADLMPPIPPGYAAPAAIPSPVPTRAARRACR